MFWVCVVQHDLTNRELDFTLGEPFVRHGQGKVFSMSCSTSPNREIELAEGEPFVGHRQEKVF
jgi:hypothetical protein